MTYQASSKVIDEAFYDFIDEAYLLLGIMIDIKLSTFHFGVLVFRRSCLGLVTLLSSVVFGDSGVVGTGDMNFHFQLWWWKELITPWGPFT